MYEFIPNELKKLRNWVCWKAEPDPKAHSGISKKPVNPRTGGLAMSNNPETWSDFETAVEASKDFAGIGFMFEGSGYFGVDLDDMDIHGDVVSEFIETLQSYAELSQSGNGVHIICKGKLPEGRRRTKNELGGFEMYDSGRFFVMTGNYCSEFIDIADCTEKIKPLHTKYLCSDMKNVKLIRQNIPVNMDIRTIVDKASNSVNGEKFRKLYSGDFSDYSSQSEADMAFCNILAFWCGGDAEKMDAVYRSSGLMRDKWDRRQSGSTYGRLTIQKAINQCENFYGHNIPQHNRYSLSVGKKTQERIKDKLYSLDDTGNAQRLRDAYGDILRYSYIDKRWLYYKDGKWSYDNIGFHRNIADASIELMERERIYYRKQDEREGTDMEKQFMKHYKKSRSFTGKTNMLKEAEHYSPILPSMLDRKKTLLNCKNGIVNLRTGEFMPHCKEEYITKITRCAYNPEAVDTPQWDKFLCGIFGGDRDLIRYIQKAVGYSLSGSTAEQCAFFLYGTGRNGKSTFLEIIRSIMGDYATNIQPQTIMVKPSSGSSPNSDIARLKGARLVTSVEPNEGMRIDEGLLKQLTGDDVVTARKLFGDEFEFKPEFKLWMATNHKPVIRGTDTGIWRRIHLIPFTVQIPEDKVDRHLKYKLAKELEGIFRWAVEGCKLWQSEGLRMPKAILDAVKEYRHEMDVISAFTDSRCTIGKGEIKASQLYAVYAKWADENNEYKMSNTKFGAEMQRRYERVKKREGWFYVGISLGSDSYSVSIG
jgi:putative DNA primase/helicase